MTVPEVRGQSAYGSALFKLIHLPGASSKPRIPCSIRGLAWRPLDFSSLPTKRSKEAGGTGSLNRFSARILEEVISAQICRIDLLILWSLKWPKSGYDARGKSAKPVG